ncbi:MAG: NAD-dependent succinate-semialdehyde dehydrogenase [Gemmatimonadaceae bacterium]
MSTQQSFPTRALVGDSWRQLTSTFDVINPATEAVLAKVADCGAAEATEAAEASVVAFQSWRRATAYERATILRRWNDLILQHHDELARLMALEMGKPIAEARGEARYAAGFVEFYAEEAKRVYGDIIPSQFVHKRLFANKKPVGPAYAITPWNFPAAMVTRKAAPALAAGCTVILKPAEQTPLTALRLAELWLDAGGPPGTLQVLPCADPVPVSRVLIEDPRIRKLSFTGSTEVGMRLYAQASQTMKRLSLELGGHAPFLVFEDADVASAVREVAASKFRNAGQTCVCTNRIYVHESVHDEFLSRFTDAVRALRLGDPLDETTQIGPLVDGAALQKVQDHVGDAVAKGAHVVIGGSALEGTFFEPTVLADVRPGMLILEEETFGPVAPVIRFGDEGDALRMANASPVGLAAYLWTKDLSRAFRVSEALEYGIVGVNDGVPSTPQAPFGGVKYSGIGREGGRWGIEEYLDVQYVSMALSGIPPSR